MVELLISFVQSVCLLGYLYGAWLVITHRSDAEPLRGRQAAYKAGEPGDDETAWRRYLAYDQGA